jgi:hypothetical protein
MPFPITWFGLEEDRFPERVYSMPIDRCVIRSLRSKLREELLSGVSPAIDFLWLDEDFPGDAGNLVGQCDDHLVAIMRCSSFVIHAPSG